MHRGQGGFSRMVKDDPDASWTGGFGKKHVSKRFCLGQEGMKTLR